MVPLDWIALIENDYYNWKFILTFRFKDAQSAQQRQQLQLIDATHSHHLKQAKTMIWNVNNGKKRVNLKMSVSGARIKRL